MTGKEQSIIEHEKLIKLTLGCNDLSLPYVDLEKCCDDVACETLMTMKKFSHKDNFPERYNLRAVCSLYSLAAIYSSKYMDDFIMCICSKSNRTPIKGWSTEKYIEYVLDTITRHYFNAQFMYSTVNRYNEMSEDFHILHQTHKDKPTIAGQLTIVVDVDNSIESIGKEVSAIILEEKTKQNLPFAQGEHTTRKPETYLPIWYESIILSRMERTGLSHREIAEKYYGTNSNIGIDSNVKKTERRIKEANLLAERAFNSQPLTLKS